MNKIKLGKVYKNIVNDKTYFKIDVRIISETEEIKKSFSRMKKYEVEEAAEEFIAKYKDINLSFNSKVLLQKHTEIGSIQLKNLLYLALHLKNMKFYIEID